MIESTRSVRAACLRIYATINTVGVHMAKIGRPDISSLQLDAPERGFWE